MMTNNRSILDEHDLCHVKAIFTGSALLRQETVNDLLKIFPNLLIRQAYGLTETCCLVSSTANFDIYIGSAGSLIPDVEARIVATDGDEIVAYDQPGELLVKSPGIVLGYLNNEKTNRETFVTDDNGDRWMRTGDEVVMRKSASGNDHLSIVDRIKELIKMRGLQVAPAELEALLLIHPAIADCAVIPVPDDAAGELPKACIVKTSTARSIAPASVLTRDICSYVEKRKARHKWLRGGVEFLDAIPKSPKGEEPGSTEAAGLEVVDKNHCR